MRTLKVFTALLYFIAFFALILPFAVFAAVEDKGGITNFSADEIEGLVKPIALFPDILVKNILPASTFPDQIVDASLLIKDKKDAAKIKDQNWDQSVKIIATYPGVLKLMYGDIGWTTRLGEAFLGQGDALLDTIQALRMKAKKEGKLQSDSKQSITTQTKGGDTIILIEPADPQVVYVPQDTIVESSGTYSNTSALVPLATFGIGMAVGAAMNDHDDDHYYYSGWGGPAFWYDDAPVNKWLDNRREVWEDHNDRAWDRQDFRQNQREDRQNFRQDMAEDGNLPSKTDRQDFRNQQLSDRKELAKNNSQSLTDRRAAANQKLESRGWSSSDSSTRRASMDKSAFSGYSSRSQTNSISSRGASSRASSGSFNSGAFRSSGGFRSSSMSRGGGGGFRGGGGRGRR